MSQTTLHRLLSAEGAALKDPTDVERALAEMWKSAGREATGEEEARTATRVSVANLIVIGAASQWDTLLNVLSELSLTYPTRTVIVLMADGQPEPAEITASVSAICHLPQTGAPQVCCEQIVLRIGAGHVDTLTQTLLPLLESDVPVMAWWRLNPLQWPGLFAAIRSLSSRLIVDAGPSGLGHLDSTARCSVRELGWYRTYPWRELIAQMFDDCRPEVATRIGRVILQTHGRSEQERLDAAWLIGFLGGQLGWTSAGARVEEPAAEGDPRRAIYAFASAHEPVEVTLVEGDGHGCGLSHLTLVSGESTFELHCYPSRAEEYRIITCDEHVCQMPRSVQMPGMRGSHALAAALVGRRIDPVFERARSIAAWIVDADT